MCNCSKTDFELLPELEMMFESDIYDAQASSGTRESKEYIIWLQKSLNQLLKLRIPLKLNGVTDRSTKIALRIFQKKAGITPQTGVPDERTEVALLKAGASLPPVHVITVPSNCAGEKNITKEFWDLMQKIKAAVRKITVQPATDKIINEINDILGPEGPVDIRKFKIFSCSRISNMLVMGETVGAEVLPAEKILHLANQTWSLATEFPRTKDLNDLITFFQIIAHEKRHATLGNTISVAIQGIKQGLDSSATDQAAYRVHEILVAAEEVAVAKTMNPAYKVPLPYQQMFYRNWNITSSLVTGAEKERLRKLVLAELRKRYLSGKGCDSSMTIGVLNCMETGRWFFCSNGTILGSMPAGLRICKNADKKTNQACHI